VVSTTPRPIYPRERPGTHCLICQSSLLFEGCTHCYEIKIVLAIAFYSSLLNIQLHWTFRYFLILWFSTTSVTDMVMNSHPSDLQVRVWLIYHCTSVGVVRDSLLSKPSSLPQSQMDGKRISTAGGTERCTYDIKVSSHYEPCHSIYITRRLNVNFSLLFFKQILPPHSNFEWKLLYCKAYLEACSLRISPKAAKRDVHEYSSVYKTLFPIVGLRKGFVEI
jgi:hypothetical protein